MNRDFKGVWIPKEIWQAKELNMNCKGLLAEIDSLDACNKTGKGCFAKNKYFSEFLGVSEKSVSSAISKLSALGYIEIVGFDGRQRYIKSLVKQKLAEIYSSGEGCIDSSSMQDSKKVKAALKKGNGSIVKKSKSSIMTNTMNNTKTNTTKSLPAKRRSSKPKDPLYAFGKDENGNPTLCQKIEASFRYVQEFTDYARERKEVKRIAEYIYQDGAEDPFEFARRILNHFYEIKKTKKLFFHDTPFAPSSFTYRIYQRVRDDMQPLSLPDDQESIKAAEALKGMKWT